MDSTSSKNPLFRKKVRAGIPVCSHEPSVQPHQSLDEAGRGPQDRGVFSFLKKIVRGSVLCQA